ncbi:MAG: PadR family transcriptional regulator [Bacteroidetes bacterium]|nr:MAG: PadR family transcriptional regulator [Bacteroidota bacterium]TAG85653.1 MAG: PadR family transcriptional regulator [Bacteroidota bacterium]
MNVENTQVQMRKGILEFCILHIISRGEIYSSDILKELKEAKIIVVEGTLYPLLTRLKNSELLGYNWKESNSGPPQKHFFLTEIGSDFLDKLNETWLDLIASTNQIIKKTNADLYKKIMEIQIEAIKILS